MNARGPCVVPREVVVARPCHGIPRRHPVNDERGVRYSTERGHFDPDLTIRNEQRYRMVVEGRRLRREEARIVTQHIESDPVNLTRGDLLAAKESAHRLAIVDPARTRQPEVV